MPNARMVPAVALLLLLVACNRTTIKSPHEVNGQVFYTEHTAPSFSDTLTSSVQQGCEGGVRDDDRASDKVPTPQGCKRKDFVLDYTVDGIYRIEACDDVYRVRCRKTTAVSGMQGPTSCGVSCELEDHFVPKK